MFKILLLGIGLFWLSGSVSSASDHIDGAASIEDGQADLTDLYAFKTPNNNDRLTVILNMYPGVAPTGHYSSKVSYDLFIRIAEANNTPLKPGFKTFVMDELNLNCKFKDPSHHTHIGNSDTAEVTCVLKKEGTPISSVTGNVGETLENQTMKLFTGPRTDSFFISAQTFLNVTSRKKFNAQSAGSGSNAMETINVMSIALELNLSSLGLKSELLALGAQSYTESDGIYETLDRVGRPEITNLSLHDFSKDTPLKRSYNKLAPFESPALINPKFRQRLVENISAYDALDASKSWTTEGLDLLTDVLIDDFLVINLDASCLDIGNQFLSIEKELLLGMEVKSCGGRKLTDDIMATLYALYINGYQADLLNFESGVSSPYQGDPTKSLKADFPYLDRSDDTSWKQWLLFEAAKMMQE